MKIGLFATFMSPIATPDMIGNFARRVEDLGIDSLWVGEHVVLFDEMEFPYPGSKDGRIPVPEGGGLLDTVAAFGFMAAKTERLRLGTGITLLPQRNVVYTAKEFATLDWLSNGRIDFGVGVGWCKEEVIACGYTFEDRGKRCDEYLEVMKRLWTDELASFEGKHYYLPECRMDPKPLQSPHVPIIVGGTNLYIQALIEGMFDGPPRDEALRAELAQWSLEALHAELARIDPEAAERIHRNDRKRGTRAVEVHRATGKPISQLQSQWAEPKRRENVFIIGLDWPVEQINRRINARVKQMIADGLVDEVRTLHERGSLGPLAREALGYKQVLTHLRGEVTLDEAIEQMKIRTRRFAKQQRTWLRRFRTHSDAIWIDCFASDPQSIAEQALTCTKSWLRGLPDPRFRCREQSSRASERS